MREVLYKNITLSRDFITRMTISKKAQIKFEKNIWKSAAIISSITSIEESENGQFRITEKRCYTKITLL